MIPLTTDDLLRFAAGLVASYFRLMEAEGPKAQAVAKSEFRGMCIAADRLDLVMTPDALHLIVQDAVRDAGPRPPYSVMGTNHRANHDGEVARAIVSALSGRIQS